MDIPIGRVCRDPECMYCKVFLGTELGVLGPRGLGFLGYLREWGDKVPAFGPCV